MSNPHQSSGGSEKVKSPASTSYPLQLVVLLVVLAVAIAIYVYLTSGEDRGASPTGTLIERTYERLG